MSDTARPTRGAEPGSPPGRLQLVTLTGDITGTYVVVSSRENGILTLQPWGAKEISVTGAVDGLRDSGLYEVREDPDGRLLLELHPAGGTLRNRNRP